MDTVALLLTLRLALVTTVILLLIAVPLACWLAFTGSRAKVFVQAVCALPIVLPPTVLGFYLLVALGPRTAFGRALTHLLGHPLAFSFAGLVVGSVIYSLPFAVQPLTAGFASVDRSMLDAATTLGSGRWDKMRRVVLPLSRGSLLTASVLSFAHTVGEFGVVLMIGGNLPGATRTLSIALYDQVQDFQYAQANRTALFLLAICLVALMLLYSLRTEQSRTKSQERRPCLTRSIPDPELADPVRPARQYSLAHRASGASLSIKRHRLSSAPRLLRLCAAHGGLRPVRIGQVFSAARHRRPAQARRRHHSSFMAPQSATRAPSANQPTRLRSRGKTSCWPGHAKPGRLPTSHRFRQRRLRYARK